jgi:hypothetical protein
MRVVALLLAVLMIGGGACGGGDESAAVSGAQAAADDYIAAEAAQDVEAVAALLQATLSDKERQRYLFFAAWQTHTVRDCEVITDTDFKSAVRCQASLVDPVWKEVGAQDIVVTYNKWSDGMTFDFGGEYTGSSVVATPSTYGDTVKAYADYLMLREPDAYAASCDPALYDVNDTVQEFGLTLVPACGELVASVGSEAAAWLAAGRPNS